MMARLWRRRIVRGVCYVAGAIAGLWLTALLVVLVAPGGPGNG